VPAAREVLDLVPNRTQQFLYQAGFEDQPRAELGLADVVGNDLLRAGMERERGDPAIGSLILPADGECEALADVFGEDVCVFGDVRVVGDRFEDGYDVLDRDPFPQQVLEDLLNVPNTECLGMSSATTVGADSLAASMICCVSWRVMRSAACLRTSSVRCVITTVVVSTTYTPRPRRTCAAIPVSTSPAGRTLAPWSGRR